MKFTILTPSYNQAAYIEENILSVLGQSNIEVEHIVVDGGSTDDTVKILKKYPHLRWVSEKDEGQADALQKGLEMSTGDIIGWINSDDYLEPEVLDAVAEIFRASSVNWVIGNITFTYDDGRKTKDKSPGITKKSLLSNPHILRQQGAFFKKRFLLDAGGFDKKYQLTMDLDLWFRLLRLSEPVMLDKNLAYFRQHEAQKTSGKHNNKQLKEILDIFRKNDAGFFYRMKAVFLKEKLQMFIRLGNLKRKLKSIFTGTV